MASKVVLSWHCLADPRAPPGLALGSSCSSSGELQVNAASLKPHVDRDLLWPLDL